MFGHSSVHLQLNWAKERIDEMDASLASLERSVKMAKAQASSDTKRLIATLRKSRARFESILKKQLKENDRAWQRSKGQLEAEWKKFEVQASHQLKSKALKMEQKAAFRRASIAQTKALYDATEKVREMMATIVPARRAGLKTAIKKMKADAAKAEARVRKLGRSSETSWPAMYSALRRSRDDFDRANQKASEIVHRVLNY